MLRTFTKRVILDNIIKVNISLTSVVNISLILGVAVSTLELPQSQPVVTTKTAASCLVHI